MPMITDICQKYLPENIINVSAIPGGNINDTYLVETAAGRYVLQRMQEGMSLSALEYNYNLYSDVFDREKILYPKWMKQQNGSYFFTDLSDEDRRSFRMYKYLEGDILSTPLSEDNCYQCGYGLGKLHSVLKALPASPRAVYPHLHDISYYYEQYREALDNIRDHEIEEIIKKTMPEMLSSEHRFISMIHGDAKLSNMLFKDGKVVGFLDFDTVMTGSVPEEIADCIRSCCLSDNSLNKSAASKLIQGYLDASGENKDIAELIPFSFKKICFELALRYYTDAISGNNYFKEHYPGYRLNRAKELLRLFMQFSF